jgi:ATP-dependent HslUV protease subunit HslV
MGTESRSRTVTRAGTRSTTILAVRHGGQVAMAGDGQVTLSDTVVKRQARKIRRLYKDRVLVGFAGSAADSLALVERFEAKLDQFQGAVQKAAIELAREWRTDRALRRLESVLVVADQENLLLVTGTGDVIVPDDGVVGVGSGGPYAAAAAKALIKHSGLSAEEVAREALLIAAQLCVYTNDQLTVEVL